MSLNVRIESGITRPRIHGTGRLGESGHLSVRETCVADIFTHAELTYVFYVAGVLSFQAFIS